MSKIKCNNKTLLKIIIFIILVANMLFSVCGQAYAFESDNKDDNDILILNEYIKITDDIKFQISKIRSLEDNSVFYFNIENSKEKNELLPLHYIFRIEKKYDGGYIPVLRPEAGTGIYKGKISDISKYQDTIQIPNKVADDEIITLNILNKNDVSIKVVEIDMEKREVTVKTEIKEVKKISQIELNKYLSAYALLNDDSNKMDKMSRYLYINSQLQNEIPEIRNAGDKTDREFENELVKSITTEKLDMIEGKKENGKAVEVLNVDEDFYVYDDELDAYICNFENVKQGQSLKINDIYFKDGIYTVTYTYLIKGTEDILNDTVEELPQKVMTIKLRLNEDTKYAKYQMVVDEDKEVVQKEEVKEDNIKNDEPEKKEIKTDTKNENVVKKESEVEKENKTQSKDGNSKEVTNISNIDNTNDSVENKAHNVKTGDNVLAYVLIIGISAGLIFVVRKIKKSRCFRKVSLKK